MRDKRTLVFLIGLVLAFVAGRLSVTQNRNAVTADRPVIQPEAHEKDSPELVIVPPNKPEEHRVIVIPVDSVRPDGSIERGMKADELERSLRVNKAFEIISP